MNYPIVTLLLVCIRWKNIVTNHPSLRSNIQFAWDKNILRQREITYSYDYDTVPPYDLVVVCTTPKQLSRAIESLNGALFSITFWNFIVPEGHDLSSWDCVPWHTFSERCTGIYIQNQSGDHTIFDNLPDLLNMKTVYCLSSISTTARGILQKILKGTSSPLISLSAGSLDTLDVGLFPHLIANLRNLDTIYSATRFTKEQTRRLVASFRDLEHLTWRGEQDDEELREAAKWRCQLKTLTTSRIVCSIFPLSILRGLVELTIECQTSSMEAHERALEGDIISFPQLTHLTLIGFWTDLLHIDAPSLHKLVLEARKLAPRSDLCREYYVKTRLRPPAVHLVDPVQGLILESLLRGPFSAVIELQIHVPALWVMAGGLKRFLSGAKTRKKKPQPPPAPPVPTLRYLIVAVYHFGPDMRRSEVEGAVEDATRSRVEQGELLSVRCLGQDVRFM
ncbi:hypothetical protein FRC17_004216 [Serendipita sp. 399]|nr:hypothetical protein FRC17_004216 [Serendipita sp. 399]